MGFKIYLFKKSEKIKITKITAKTVLIIKAFLSFTALRISLASSDTTIYPASWLLSLTLLRVLTKKLFCIFRILSMAHFDIYF